MRRQYRKYAVWGAAFAVLITLGAATAAFTAGAAPFQAEATTTIVTTITTTTPDSTSTSSTDTTSSDTTSTDTTTTTDDSGGGGTAPAATPTKAEPKFTG
jgi:hypothetical protein